MELRTSAGSRRTAVGLFSALCIGAVCLILAAYLLLVSSNAIYLGWNDGMYFLRHPRMWERIWLTVRTATTATCLSMVIGIPAGYALSRRRFRWPNLFATLIDLPIMVPPAAVGVFLFGFVRTFPVRPLFDFVGISPGHNVAGVVLVQFTVTVAFCARLAKASFDAVNPRMEQVSRSLGASLPRTFVLVTLPLAKNGIVAGLIAVWARAVAEWEALMLFVGGIEGTTDVMPFAVYLDWNGAMMGWVVSMSLVCLCMAAATMGAVRAIGGRSYVW